MDSCWGGPRFFKILVQETLQANSMLIPTKFVKEHCHGLSNQIILKVPNGEAWPVELVRDEVRELVWFGRGWKHFSQRYSFQHGHFLLFELLHNSSFLVLIFNRTAAEIDYSKQDWELAQTVLEMEVEEQGPPLGRTRMNTIMEKFNGKTDHATQVAGKGENLIPISKMLSSKTASCSAATNMVPPSFRKVITKAACPAVPFGFMEKYVTKSSEAMLCLKVDGRTWPVKLKNFHQHKFCQLSKGWLKFARENNLKVGDTCTFQLLGSTVTNEFIVHVSRC